MTADETKLEEESSEEQETTRREGDQTRIEGSDSDETVLEEGVAKQSGGLGLMGRTFEGRDSTYRVIEALPATGSEADIYVVQSEGADDQRVLKYYRRGISPKAEITEMLAGLDPEHVVRVYETGERDGRSYEIQEFVEHGSLADMVKPGGLPEARMKEVLHEMLIAVEHLHECRVIHRDLKPSNVLVRTLDPLDLVFIDFGIASQTELSLHATSANRTVIYAAPEALTGVVSTASDWWSVGVMLLELLSGKHPFVGLDEVTVNFRLVTSGVDVPAEISDDWQLLLKGLLTRDHEKRWNPKLVRKWLDGERSMSVAYDAENAQALRSGDFGYSPYAFAGKKFHDPAELAVALGENWKEGVKHFGRGLLTKWLKDDLRHAEWTSRFTDLAEDEELSANQKLSVALLTLNPDLPLMDEGGVLTSKNLPQRMNKLQEILNSTLGWWVNECRGDDWLVELSKKWKKFDAELGRLLNKQISSIDKDLAGQLFLLEGNVLTKKWVKHRKAYADTEIAPLKGELSKPRASKSKKVALLAMLPTKLKTHEQVRKEKLEANLVEYLRFLDINKAMDFDLQSDKELDREWKKLRQKYKGCTIHSLSGVLSTGKATRIQKIVLLSLQPAKLKTHEKVRKEKLKKSLGKYFRYVDFVKASDLGELKDVELNNKWKELRQKYIACEFSHFNKALSTGNATNIVKITLLSMRPRYLKNAERVRKDKLVDSLGEYSEYVDLDEADRLDLLDDGQLKIKLEKWKRHYHGSIVPALDELIDSPEFTRRNALILLASRDQHIVVFSVQARRVMFAGLKWFLPSFVALLFIVYAEGVAASLSDSSFASWVISGFMLLWFFAFPCIFLSLRTSPKRLGLTVLHGIEGPPYGTILLVCMWLLIFMNENLSFFWAMVAGIVTTLVHLPDLRAWLTDTIEGFFN
ncbi:MAG: hypothetical protein CMI31_09180 [Opitutae bacterium]|nr:hypothetical protein [Opitutae bacterium]|tara:strand:- start:1789 stop:4551 length:2763 start_codon:yes stop_codon:yes gene_type:complete